MTSFEADKTHDNIRTHKEFGPKFIAKTCSVTTQSGKINDG